MVRKEKNWEVASRVWLEEIQAAEERFVQVGTVTVISVPTGVFTMDLGCPVMAWENEEMKGYADKGRWWLRFVS